MSVYDEVRCEYPLPDGFTLGARVFRTTDTPAQWLECYVLQADGRLRHEATGALLLLDGVVTLYTDNLNNWAPWGYATDDDQPAWTATYHATFVAGQLVSLTGEQAPYEDPDHPRLTREAWGAQAAEGPHGS